MPLASIEQISGIGSAQHPPTVEVAQALPHTSSAQGAAAFARAVDTPTFEIQASVPTRGGTLSGHFADQAQALSLQFNAIEKAQTAPPSTAAADGAPVDLAKTMDGAVSGMQSAYLFAIETAMASRGSTEMTKIFNTLLKGQ
jgi:hypothetical protein